MTFGLIILSFIFPWLALYLDGASWPTVGLNFGAWFFFPIIGTVGATIHAIICVCRSGKHRMYSKPARRRLRYDNNYSAGTSAKERKASEPGPSPVAISRAVAEDPAPVERAPTERPAPLQKAVTESPSVESPKASSTSVSSSDAEKDNPPAAAPPTRTASAPPL